MTLFPVQVALMMSHNTRCHYDVTQYEMHWGTLGGGTGTGDRKCALVGELTVTSAARVCMLSFTVYIITISSVACP